MENSAKCLEPIKLQAVDRDIGINSAIVYNWIIININYLTDYFTIKTRFNPGYVTFSIRRELEKSNN